MRLKIFFPTIISRFVRVILTPGHVNLLCIVPSLSQVSEETSFPLLLVDFRKQKLVISISSSIKHVLEFNMLYIAIINLIPETDLNTP